MDLPVAVVISLPKIGSFSPLSHRSFTDILLYFPMPGQVMVFDYTIGDLRRVNKGADIKYYGTFDVDPKTSKLNVPGRIAGIAIDHGIDIEHTPRKTKIKRYNYTVELSPFLTLHGAPCPNIVDAYFVINAMYSSKLIIKIDYNDNNRELEKITLFFGGLFEKKTIAVWQPNRSNYDDIEIYTWDSSSGYSVRELPMIRGYFEETEDDERTDDADTDDDGGMMF